MRWFHAISLISAALVLYIAVPFSTWDSWRNRLTGVQNPADLDVCFVRDLPGATDRYVTYQPVSCRDQRTTITVDTPNHYIPIGATFGELRYKDMDADGVAEIILESNSEWTVEYHIHDRYVYAIVQKPVLMLVQRSHSRTEINGE